jgi:hypothetical protein
VGNRPARDHHARARQAREQKRASLPARAARLALQLVDGPVDREAARPQDKTLPAAVAGVTFPSHGVELMARCISPPAAGGKLRGCLK